MKYLWAKKHGRRVHILDAEGRSLCQTENGWKSKENFARKTIRSETFPVHETDRILCRNCADIQGYKRPIEMAEWEYPF